MYELHLKSVVGFDGMQRHIERFAKTMDCALRWSNNQEATLIPEEQTRQKMLCLKSCALKDWRIARFLHVSADTSMAGGVSTLGDHALARLTKTLRACRHYDAIRKVYALADSLVNRRAYNDSETHLKLLFDYFDGLPGPAWTALLTCTYDIDHDLNEKTPSRLCYKTRTFVYLHGARAVHVPLTEDIMTIISERLDMLRNQHCRDKVEYLFCDDRAEPFASKKALMKYLGLAGKGVRVL